MSPMWYLYIQVAPLYRLWIKKNKKKKQKKKNKTKKQKKNKKNKKTKQKKTAVYCISYNCTISEHA